MSDSSSQPTADAEPLSDRPRRTHTCGGLRREHVGQQVTLMGWIHSRRDLGSLCFVDLRDRYGLTQVRFETESDPALLEIAHRLRSEFVIAVRGVVVERPEGTLNAELATGEVEVEASAIKILSEAKTPPFEIRDDVGASEELRLRYRYLDLRRKPMQDQLVRRHRMVHALRTSLDAMNFVEVETPGLTRSMPEGARDYLVPSRVHKGHFYALPQSPQLFKQLLMVAGLDRYYQIVKCFRDEDLRADRQPEFTQIDLELSFGTEEDVYEVIEKAVAAAVKAVTGKEISTPFQRIPYDESMARYGVDKPDLRYGLPIVEASDVVGSCSFQVFKDILAGGGVARGIRVPDGGAWSRKQVESLEPVVKEFGAQGLAWAKVKGPDSLQGPLSRFFEGEQTRELLELFEAVEGDLIVLVVSDRAIVERSLGELRKELANRLELIPKGVFEFCWVTEFPMFEKDEETGVLVSSHHPFTMPNEEVEGQLESAPERIKARSYDLVLNGWELGSGGIRIHDRELQQRVFQALSISADEARSRFGFLLDAFDYGAPPHCGIALGVDRLAALLVEVANIREVVAFPKTASAACLMTGAPESVDPRQLEDVGIAVVAPPESPEDGASGPEEEN